MTDRPVRDSASDVSSESVQLIEALYTLADINVEIHGLAPKPMRHLDADEDVGLVDDVIDALLDPADIVYTRRVLRNALSAIAARALIKGDNDR